MIEQVLTAFILPVSFLGIGHCILKLLGFRLRRELTGGFFHIIAFALGLTFFSYYWFVAGLLGFLGKAALLFYWTLSLPFIVFARDVLGDLLLQLQKAGQIIWDSGWLARLLALEVFLLFVWTLLRCGTPTIEGDSLVYHLYLPKQFVMQGRIWAVPFSEHAFWPLLAEMCFIPGEIIKSVVVPKLISFSVYTAFFLMAGSFVYEKTGDILSALIASLLIASCPVFFNHAPSTYNDLFFGFFLAASLLAFLFREGGSDFFSGRTGLVSGLLAGAAIASKYTALYGLVGIIAVFFVLLITGKDKVKLVGAFFPFLGGVAVTGSPFYFRAYFQYGNPVFPFAQRIFHTSFGYGLTQAGLVGSNLNDFIPGAGRGLFNFLILPLTLTFQPQSFGGDKLGFLFLILGGFIFFAAKKNTPFMIFCLVYISIWFFLSQYTRYLMPVLGVAAVMIGFGYAAIESRFTVFSRIILFFVLILGGLQTAWAGYRCYKDCVHPKKDKMLRVASEINQTVLDPKEPVLVIGDSRIYYYDFVAFREKPFRHFTQYPDMKLDETVRLLDNQGVHFLLRVETPDAEPPRESGEFDPFRYFTNLTEKGFYSSSLIVKKDGQKFILLRRTTLKAL